MASTPKPVPFLYVSASAAPGGDGSAEHPFNTIQAAVNKAQPGTTIMVGKGEYHENVTFGRTINGTEKAPITLVSSDGPQAAHIIAATDSKAAIVGGGNENIVVKGFWISGGLNGIQFSQNGYDYTDMVKNITVVGNVIDNFVKDGVKINGGDYVIVTNNKINGGSDNGIDFMSINNGVISSNEVSNSKGTSAGILVKGGSTLIDILNNYVHDVKADGISVGGWTGYDYQFRPGYDTAQASQVTVEHNRVEHVGKRPLSFYGATDSVARENILQATPKYYTVVLVGNSNETYKGVFHSANVTVEDNYINRDTSVVFVEAGSSFATFLNNAVSTLKLVTGADLSVSGWSAQVTWPTPEAPAVVSEAAPVASTPLPPIVVPLWTASAEATTKIWTADGTAGADSMRGTMAKLAGGLGDDTYQVTKTSQTVVEAAGGGNDTVNLYGRFHVLEANVEHMVAMSSAGAVLFGNDANNMLTGNAGADFLDGRGGSNLLTGGAGADVFTIGDTAALTRISDFAHGDVIHVGGDNYATFAELQKHMVDTADGTQITLRDGRVIDVLGMHAADLTQSDFDFGVQDVATKGAFNATRVTASSATHIATGTAEAESVYGIGNSVLAGGDGDDSYFVKAGDYIVERAGGGIDTAVLATVTSYTLDANVENALIKNAAGAHVDGNGLANVITGYNGADVIRGGAGADLLTGGAGSDHFVYGAGDGGDVITDFVIGTDHLDVGAITALDSSAVFSVHDSDAGLVVEVTYGSGEVELLATLAGQHGPVAVDHLF